MTVFTEQLVEFDAGIADELARSLRKLATRLSAFAHAPVNKQHVRRMDSFSRTPGLPMYVGRFLDNYVKKERFGTPEASVNAQVECHLVWYCIALLLRSDEKQPFIVQHAHWMLSAPKGSVSVFVRLLRLAESEHYNVELERLIAYEVELKRATEAWRWAEAIGLGVPADRSWRVSVLMRCTAVDAGVGSVSLFIVVDPSFSGRSYRIKLRGFEPTAFAESWDDDSDVARIGLRDGPRELQTPPRLMAVPALLCDLESVMGVSYERSIEGTTCSRGVKGRGCLQRWLMQEGAS